MFRLSNLLCLVTVSCTLAVAQLAVAAPSENILLLGVARTGKFDHHLTKDLSDHLARSGETVNQHATLSAQDRACTDQECLDSLAARESAQVVLTTQLQENGPDAYYVVMTLFDAVRHSPLAERSLCDQCTDDTLTLKLAGTADKLLKRYRDRKNGVAPDPAEATPVNPPPGSGITSPPEGHLVAPPGSGTTTTTQGWTLSPKRKIIAGVLGGLAGVTLITSIPLTVTDGANSGPSSCGAANMLCVFDNKGLYITGYVATGLLVGGMLATIFWPQEKMSTATQAVAEVK